MSRWLCCLVLACVVFCCAECLDIRLFNVGQGNFVVAKRGEYALVIDCGYGRMGLQLEGMESFADMWKLRNDFSPLAKNLLENYFDKVTHLKVVITHNHDDHLNLLDNLLKLIRDDRELNIPDVHVFYGFKGDGADSVRSATVFFANSLGTDVDVVPIRPLRYPTVGGAHEEHRRNLIVRNR